jgi:5'-3' exoribonuclease 2
LGETTYVPVETNAPPPIHPSLPQRPAFDVAAPAQSSQPSSHAPQAAPAQDGIKLASNHDVVANRRAIRMANMNAAEMLKAELAGRASAQTLQQPADENVVVPRVPATASDAPVEPPPVPLPSVGPLTSYDDYASMDVLPGLGGPQSAPTPDPVGIPNPPLSIEAPSILSPPVSVSVSQSGADAPPPPDLPPVDTQATEENDTMDTDVPVDVPVNGVNGTVDGQETDESRGTKRKLEDAIEGEDSFAADEEEAPDVLDAPAAARKVNPDGTVEQEDTVKCVSFDFGHSRKLTCALSGYGNLGTRNGTIDRSSVLSSATSILGSSAHLASHTHLFAES